MWSREKLRDSASFNISIIRVVWVWGLFLFFFYLCALLTELKLFELGFCASASCRDGNAPLMLYGGGRELIQRGAGHSYLEVGRLMPVGEHVVISSCKEPGEV